MSKLIFLIVGVALGVLLVLIWPQLAPDQQQEPAKPRASLKITIEGENVTHHGYGLKRPASKLDQVTEAVAPRSSITYPDSSLSLLLDKPSPELGEAGSQVLSRPTVADSDSGLLYAALAQPPSSLSVKSRAGPLISHPDAAEVFMMEQLLQELIASATQVQGHPAVKGPDAGWIMRLVPPMGLFEEDE